MVVKGLAGFVRQTSKQNVLKGVKVVRNGIDCCMLQFADEILFLCDDSFSSIFSIKAILIEFVSGMKVNFHKSKLASVCVDKYSLNTYAKTLNYNTMQITFKYLGGRSRR